MGYVWDDDRSVSLHHMEETAIFAWGEIKNGWSLHRFHFQT